MHDTFVAVYVATLSCVGVVLAIWAGWPSGRQAPAFLLGLALFFIFGLLCHLHTYWPVGLAAIMWVKMVGISVLGALIAGAFVFLLMMLAGLFIETRKHGTRAP